MTNVSGLRLSGVCRRGAWIAALGWIFTVASAAVPAHADATITDGIAQDLDGVVRRFVARKEFNGNVLVAKRGTILLRKSYGVADRASGRVNDVENRFTLASITKPMTATLILQQVELGRLSLEDPIHQYLPEAPAHWAPIHVKNLLNHTSGIMDFLNSPILEDIRDLPLEPLEILARFRNDPLLFTPGSQVSYSNSGFTILALILERVAGKPYSQLIHEGLFARAGMNGSGLLGVNVGDFPRESYSTGYRLRENGEWYVPAGIHPKILFGLGSVFSTLDDLYAFDQALYDDRLLSAATRELMFTPTLGRTGLGFSHRVLNGHRMVFHEGHVGGFSNRFSRYFEAGVTIILLGNLRDSKVTELSAALAEVVL